MFTVTRDTAAEDAEGRYAEVMAFPVVPDELESGGPTHTGRSPALLDPADGPAVSGKVFLLGATRAREAVAVWAAGQIVCG